MNVQYVGIANHSAWLNTEFGLNLACKKLGMTPEQVEALVGRATKGKRVGELRGQLVWYAVTSPGWVKMGRYDHEAMQGNGFVQRMKVSYGYAIVNPWKNAPDSNGPLVLAMDPDYHEDNKVALQHYNIRIQTLAQTNQSSTG